MAAHLEGARRPVEHQRLLQARPREVGKLAEIDLLMLYKRHQHGHRRRAASDVPVQRRGGVGTGEDVAAHEQAPGKILPVGALAKAGHLHEERPVVGEEVLDLVQPHWMCDYDQTQAIGRRYRRQDEIGTPYCVTIDFETLEDKAVTVRERDSMDQDRVPIKELVEYLSSRLIP